MQNVPLVLIRDPLRAAVATLILFAISLSVGGLAVGWLVSPATDLPLAAMDLGVVTIIASLALRYVPGLIYRAIFPASARAIQAMRGGRFDEAAAHYRQLAEAVERRPLLEKLRTPLFLDVLGYSWRASSLINLAYCQTRTGDIAGAVASYERCLEFEPDNVVALSALNLINLFQGKAVRPARDLIERYLFDPGEQQRFAVITLGIEVLAICGCMQASAAVLMAALVNTDSIFWLVMGMALLVVGSVRIYRWGARRLFLADLYRGVGLLKKGAAEQALIAFQAQYYVLDSQKWVDQFRGLALLSPTRYSFREMALLYQAAPCVQLGEPERIVEATRECLRINPENTFARNRMDLIEMVRKAAQLQEQDRA